jgi:hypothetical protein
LVAGRLSWYSTDELQPKIVFAPDRHAFFDVTRLNQASGSTVQPARVGDLEPELQSFETPSRRSTTLRRTASV